MYEVDDLFEGMECRTRVWVSQKAAAAILEHDRRRGKRRKADPRGEFLQALERYAANGFAHYEGAQGRPIRHEGDGVYRIGMKRSLFRIIGFYEDESRADFIAIDTFTKKGQSLSGSQRKRIREAARVKRDRLWKRRWKR